MKIRLATFTASSILFVTISYAQDAPRAKEKIADDGRKIIEVTDPGRGEETEQSDINATNLFDAVVNSPSIPTEVAKRTADFIKHLLSKRKIDTDLLYGYVQTLNANLSALEDNEFVRDMRVITDKLRDSSYTDKIHYNTNLSNQLRTRMPIIVAASAKLNDTTLTASQVEFLKEDFRDELNLFSDKYLKTSRFQAGLGISYAYTPIIEYTSNSRLDLSQFAPSTGGRSTLVNFDQEFANKSYINFEIAAKLPWLEQV